MTVICCYTAKKKKKPEIKLVTLRLQSATHLPFYQQKNKYQQNKCRAFFFLFLFFSITSQIKCHRKSMNEIWWTDYLKNRAREKMFFFSLSMRTDISFGLSIRTPLIYILFSFLFLPLHYSIKSPLLFVLFLQGYD